MTNMTKSYIVWKIVTVIVLLLSIVIDKTSNKSIWLDTLLGYCAIQSLVLLAYYAYNERSRLTQNRWLYLCHSIISSISIWIVTWTFDSKLSILGLFDVQVFAKDGKACGVGITYLAVIAFELVCIQLHNALNTFVKHD